MAVNYISRTTIVTVMVAMTAAMVLRSWLQVHLLQRGMQSALAADVSYLIVPPVLVLLLFPLWRTERFFLGAQFHRQSLSWRLALRAIAIGLLMRLLWWSQLIAGVSFGIYSSSNSDDSVGPIFSFNCASPGVVFLGFIAMVVLIPLIEEIVHRGYVQSALRQLGRVKAVILSALIFTVFHSFISWPFAFFAGIVFGLQYWSTQSLWSSLLSHMTVNTLILLDWRCVSGQWNPRAADLPLLIPGTVASTVFIACLAVLVVVLHGMLTEAAKTPRSA